MAKRNSLLPRITDIDEISDSMARMGAITSGQPNDWRERIYMLNMAQKTDPQTMGGFALGKLLRGLFDTWKEHYDYRGGIKNALNVADEAEKNKILTEMYNRNRDMYNRYAKRFNLPSNPTATQQTPQPTPTPATQATPTPEQPTTQQGLLFSPEMLAQVSNYLSTQSGQSGLDPALLDKLINKPTEVNTPFEDKLFRGWR